MVGNQYKSYPSKEKGLNALETLLKAYVKDYRYDLKAIRYEYCGPHCGDKDYQTFKQIYYEELEKQNEQSR